MSSEERQLAELELEDKDTKFKRRMMATIRFIGELCKEGLLKISIMHQCIVNLIGVSDENGELVRFKEVQDEQYLELLCKLLHTVGAKLEESAMGNCDQMGRIDFYFHRLQELSRDKSLNSRIRFSLEEVIELRRNGWRARREQEGPARLTEIHEKAAAEEMMKQQRGAGGKWPGPQGQSRGQPLHQHESDRSGGGGRGGAGLDTRGHYDARGDRDSRDQKDHRQDARGEPPRSDQRGDYRGSGSDFRGDPDQRDQRFDPRDRDRGDARDRRGDPQDQRGGSGPKYDTRDYDRDGRQRSSGIFPGGGGLDRDGRGGAGGGRGFPPHQQQDSRGVSGGGRGNYDDRDRDRDRDRGDARDRDSNRGPRDRGERDNRVDTRGDRDSGRDQKYSSSSTGTARGNPQSPGMGASSMSTPPVSARGMATTGSGTTAPTTGADLTDKQISDKVSATIDEYLNIKDADEAESSLRELGVQAVGHFILKIINKYINTIKADVQNSLLKMLADMINILRDAQSEVEAALTRCEELCTLCDILTDCKHAPEWIGAIVGDLVRLGLCSLESVSEMVAVMKKYAIESDPEFGPKPEEVEKVYGAFLSAVKSHST